MPPFFRASALGLGACFAASMMGGPGSAQELPSPPWLAHGAHNLLIGFEADPEALRALLPAGLEPASPVVWLNMYEVPRGLGIPAYNRSYIYADVVGYDAHDGTKGRYVMVGWAEPAPFGAIARERLHWPAEGGRTRVTREGDAVAAELTVGGEVLIRARARIAAAPGEQAMAMLPYLFVVDEAQGRAATPADVGVNLVAFAGELREGAPEAVEIAAEGGDPLARLAPKRLVQAIEVRDGTFVLGVVDPPDAR